MATATTKVLYSTAAITHIGAGGALAAGAISAESVTSTALGSTNLGLYPRADLILTASHTTSLSSASNIVALYRRDMNIDGTADENVPQTATGTLYKGKFVGAFLAQAKPTSNTNVQYMQITDVPLAKECEFYIENLTNAAFTEWTLKVLPKTDSGEG